MSIIKHSQKSILFLSFATILLLLAESVYANNGSNGDSAQNPPELILSENMRGQAAINALADRLPEVAAWYHMKAEKLIQLLETDSTLWVDTAGRLFYADEFDVYTAEPAQTETSIQASSLILEDTFFLHSRASAKKVIYLDFNGAVVSGTAWNASNNDGNDIVCAPFDLDGNPSSFSDTELERIQYIFMRVAEDFLPFDVDVTTEEPSPDRIAKDNSGDEYFGVPVLITPTYEWFGNYGGVAYVGIFSNTSDYYKPAFVFSSMLANAEKYIAEAISHEAGHNLNLHHDGDVSTTYYRGHGDGQIGWAPIMGVGYYKNLVQWSKGEYPNAYNLQDDLLIIQAEGEFGYIVDDHGNGISSATWISSQADGTLSAKGIIEQNTDIDVFGFATELGQVLINITPALKGPNLDILTELYDENGFFVLSDNPSLELASGIDTTLNQGIYYLVIKGTENINASDYGSMGSYSISATLPVSGSNSPPEAVASANPTSGMAPLTVSFSGSGSSDLDGDIVGYSWDFKDNNKYGSGENTSYTYTTGGIYNVEMTVIDDKGATDLSIVTVEVMQAPAEPPIAAFSVNPASGGAVPLTVQFTDLSTGGVITNWNWKIERYHEKRNRWINVTDLTEQDPSVVLEKASLYRTTLTVTGPGGSDTQVGDEITVTGSTNGGGNNGGGNNGGGGGRGKNK